MTARTAFVPAVCLLLLAKTTLDAQVGNRALIHVFQDNSRNVAIRIVDLPSGPQGSIITEGSTTADFTISKGAFDKIWSTLTANSLNKYAGDQKRLSLLDALVGLTKYYVFSVYMVDGTKKYYAVPTSEASARIAELARQLRAYAK